jgi:hypothetical protein
VRRHFRKQGSAVVELSQRDEYLRKAEEAEREQQRAKEPQIKEAWEHVVVGYLELAQSVGLRDALQLGELVGRD